MKTSTRIRHSLYLCVVLTQLLVTGCSSPPTEQAITDALHEMAGALQDRESSPVLDRLHENFRSEGAGSTMNRRDIQRLLLATFYRHQSISVTLTNIRVETDTMNKNRATAYFNALTTGSDGGWLPNTAQLYRVESEWVLDGDWMMQSLSAKRALEQ